jgi:hypothetical protein
MDDREAGKGSDERHAERPEDAGDQWITQATGNELRYVLANSFFQFFVVCSRLLIAIGAARTTSEASRMLKFRSDRGWITLTGKWKCPGRSAPEYYWSSRPVGPRIFPHQAAIANLCDDWFRYGRFLRMQFGVGKDALIPDWVMEIGGVRFYGEYFNAGTESHAVIGEKLEKYQQHIGDDWLLLVTSGGPVHVRNLVETASRIQTARVARLEEVLLDPWGRYWREPGSEMLRKIDKPELQGVAAEIDPETADNAGH